MLETKSEMGKEREMDNGSVCMDSVAQRVLQSPGIMFFSRVQKKQNKKQKILFYVRLANVALT